MHETALTLDALFAELDTYAERIPLDELVARLGRLQITRRDVERVARFSPVRYVRNLLRVGRSYQALVLCWSAGQRSPIHDHRGSSCGVRVITGTAIETIFERTAAGAVFATESHALHEGGCCGSQDSDLHQVSNLAEDGSDLITLHIYSPPLLRMGVYSLTDNEVREMCDPVLGMMDGAGI